MENITDIISAKKAIKSLYGDKQEKRHKLEYLNGIWEAVAQLMKCPNYQIDDLAQKYINYFSSRAEEFYPELKNNPSKGLCVMGDVGTGKTLNFRVYQQVYQKINIKNEFGKVFPPLHTINDDTFYMVHVKQIESGLKVEGEAFLERLVRYKKLVIDDLGVDADDLKDYGTSRNPVIDVISRRYDKMYTDGLVTHFTTNMNSAEIKKKYGDRNADRITEMSIKVGIKGKSKRV
jgi:DNA replication protein DnaC